MWDFPEQSYIPFPSFIDASSFKLGERCEIISEFCRFKWREVLREEFIGHLILRCLVFLCKKLNHVFALSLKEKGKVSALLPPGTRHLSFVCHPLFVAYL